MNPNDIFSINEPLYQKYASPEDWHLYEQELKKITGIIQNYGAVLGSELIAYINCKGILLEKLNRNAEAVEEFKNALNIDPQYIHSLISLAFTYGKTNDFENSLHYYELALQSKPDFVTIYKSRALIYRKNEKFSLALQDCDTALKLEPQNAEVISVKTEFLLDLRRLQEAEDFLNQNLLFLQSSNYYDYTKGLMLVFQSAYKEALTHFLAFEQNHKNVDTYEKIATCCYSLQDYPGFFKYLQLAKNHDRYSLNIINLELTYYINAGDYYTGIQLTEKYLREVGGHYLLYCKLAFFYRRIGFFDRAEHALSTVLAMPVKTVAALEELVKHYMETDKLETALQYAKEMISISEFEGLKRAASIYLTIENHKKTYQTRAYDLLESYKYFTKAYALFKNDSELLEMGAIIMNRANKYDTAISLMDHAIALVPDMFTVYRTKANIMHLHKEYEAAAGLYSTSIKLNLNNTDNYFNRGFCFHHLNRLPEAESDFLKSIKTYIANSVNKPGLKLSKFKPANDYLLTSLKQEEIWFSHPSTFNDALDCNFLQDYWEPNESLKSSLDKVFVCCLRALEEKEDPASSFFFTENLMWAHYAESYRGVQLIYEITEPKSEIPYRGDYVSYNDVLQMPVSENNYDLISSVNRTLQFGFFIKFKDWQYEKEFRLLTVPENPGSKYAGYKTASLGMRLTTIIFGLNCNPAFKSKAHEIVSAYTYPVQLVEIVKNLSAQDHFTLQKRAYASATENTDR